ncbi:MAG: tryptophan synthase subunit alpha [Chlamydiae bacterium]|nr:tryptophan synthase subunit alpha [Chlamydiota bacterium]MBI3266008.1 tryptophan synthase subunit alpha [Chlamydiota bacterium]
MSRIEKKFLELKKSGRKGLITYIAAGDPDLSKTIDLVKSFEDAGVDFVELGIPFSDPLADGAVNQMAADRALKSGTTLKKIFAAVIEIRKSVHLPIIFFTYLNPILKYGLENFAREAAQAGVDGVLALDLPPEESDEYKKLMNKHHLDTIFLVTPTSSIHRMKLIASKATGFIYCVSRTGVTGMQQEISKEVPSLIKRIKSVSDLPVAIGFGVSNGEQVRQLSKYADAVVVGSAIVKKIEENVSRSHLLGEVTNFVRDLAVGLHG